jgi:hypothetical protein
MSKNPYAHPDQYDPGRPEYVEPRRTSLLAVSSLVVSIIGLIVCCIPGPGLLGLLLGVLALFTISAAQGRVGGRGLAFGGIVIGLLATVLGVGIWIGTAQAYGSFFAAPTHRFLSAVDQGDYATARNLLSPPAAQAATDQEFDRFAQEIRARLGAYRSTPRGLLGYAGALMETMEHTQAATQRHRIVDSVPLAAEYDQGRVGVIVVPDRNATGSGIGGTTSNVGIITVDGHEIWLFPPGPPVRAPVGTPPVPPPPAPGTDPPPADPGPTGG